MGLNPQKPGCNPDVGERDVPVSFCGVTINPGDWLYCDDGECPTPCCRGSGTGAQGGKGADKSLAGSLWWCSSPLQAPEPHSQQHLVGAPMHLQMVLWCPRTLWSSPLARRRTLRDDASGHGASSAQPVWSVWAGEL